MKIERFKQIYKSEQAKIRGENFHQQISKLFPFSFLTTPPTDLPLRPRLGILFGDFCITSTAFGGVTCPAPKHRLATPFLINVLSARYIECIYL